MAINPPAHNAAQAGRPRLRKSLKLWQVVMMGLAYLTPMTVFDTFGIVSGISNGHVPASYLLALAGVLFTAISYGKLVRQFPEAGSAYTYAQKSISPHVGFMVGWSSLLDYLFLPMINVLLAKIYLSALFPEVPPWVWVVTFVAILTAANLKSVNLVANFNTLFVLVQISIMVVFVILVVQGLHKGEGVGTVWSLQPFISQNAHLIPIITGATIVCFSFLGFDAVTTLSEETPDAARVIPKAIFLTAMYGGIIFIVASFFMQLFFPDILQNFIIELSGKIFCHRKVHIEIVSAVAGSGTRNFTFVIADKEEHLLKQRDNVRRLIIAGEKQVESGAASHRSEVENFIFVYTVVS